MEIHASTLLTFIFFIARVIKFELPFDVFVLLLAKAS